MKSNDRGFSALLVLSLLVIVAVIGFVGWQVWRNKTSDSHQPTAAKNSSKSPGCAYMPTHNFKENENLYKTYRTAAQKINFAVYLPCSYHPGFRLTKLGITEVTDKEVPYVFLDFERLKAQGTGNLPASESFTVLALPAQHQPPTACVQDYTLPLPTVPCTKLGDSKFGPVYWAGEGASQQEGDIFIATADSLIVWSHVVHSTPDDVQPLIDIINSLQKVEPTQLEFFYDG